MFKVAAIIWVIGGTLLAGIFVTIVLATPSLNAQAMTLMAPAGIGGYVVAIPFAYLVAKAILAAQRA